MGLIRGIQMFLFVFVLFTVTEEHISFFTVATRDEVALPCGNVTEKQQNCVNASWFFKHWPGREMELLTQGNLTIKTDPTSDRPRVTADCSLVIPEVTAGDAGRYTCRQFKSGERYQDAHVSLSVINVVRWWSFEEVEFRCCLSSYDGCWHSIKWLYNGSTPDLKTASDTCSAQFTVPISHLKQKSDVDELLYWNVTDKKSGETVLCDVKFPFSCRKPGSPSSGRNPTADEDSHINKAGTDEHVPSLTAEKGDEVTLPCGNVTETRQNCDGVSWFIRERPYSSLKLLTQGNKSDEKNSESDKFRVTVNCSLVITEVKDKNAGRYTCRQIRPGEHAQDAHASLSVITFDTEWVNGKFFFLCTVSAFDGCMHTVHWMFKGRKETPKHSCPARVRFKTSDLQRNSNSDELPYCNVTDQQSGQTLLCYVGPWPSCKNAESPSTERNRTSEEDHQTNQGSGGLRFMMVSVGLSVLMISVMLIVIWTRIKGKETLRDYDTVQKDEVDDFVVFDKSEGRDVSVHLKRSATL